MNKTISESTAFMISKIGPTLRYIEELIDAHGDLWLNELERMWRKQLRLDRFELRRR